MFSVRLNDQLQEVFTSCAKQYHRGQDGFKELFNFNIVETFYKYLGLIATISKGANSRFCFMVMFSRRTVHEGKAFQNGRKASSRQCSAHVPKLAYLCHLRGPFQNYPTNQLLSG